MAGPLKVFAYFALIALALGIALFQQGNLVEPIPLLLTLVAAACGAGLGYLAAADSIALMPEKKLYGQMAMLVMMPAFGLVAGTLLTRSLVLQAAFIGVSTTPQMATFAVEDSDRQGRRRFSSGRSHWLIITLPEERREFRVPVDQALYQTVGPNPAPGTHCLTLPLERGRWGIRRALAPNHFDRPLGLEHHRRC